MKVYGLYIKHLVIFVKSNLNCPSRLGMLNNCNTIGTVINQFIINIDRLTEIISLYKKKTVYNEIKLFNHFVPCIEIKQSTKFNRFKL